MECRSSSSTSQDLLRYWSSSRYVVTDASKAQSIFWTNAPYWVIWIFLIHCKGIPTTQTVISSPHALLMWCYSRRPCFCGWNIDCFPNAEEITILIKFQNLAHTKVCNSPHLARISVIELDWEVSVYRKETILHLIQERYNFEKIEHLLHENYTRTQTNLEFSEKFPSIGGLNGQPRKWLYKKVNESAMDARSIYFSIPWRESKIFQRIPTHRYFGMEHPYA